MLRFIRQSRVAQYIIAAYMSLASVMPFILIIVLPGLKALVALVGYGAVWYALWRWAVNEETGI